MKRLTVILNSVIPLIAFIFTLGLLSLSSKIFTTFYSEFLEEAALPVLTQFFIGGSSSAKLILAAALIVALSASILLPILIKDNEKLMIAYSIYHTGILIFVTVFIGGLLLALSLPLHEADVSLSG